MITEDAFKLQAITRSASKIEIRAVHIMKDGSLPMIDDYAQNEGR